MKQKTLSKIFIWGFLILYVLVALISFVHAISFFNIGNENWMSICLAGAFELGLALSLCSILLSDGNRKNTLPWILMIVLTFVQIIGNVYATFSHIAMADASYYQNLAKPLLFFMEDVPENTVQVIISWIMGAILPVVALMMTDMIASNIKMQSDPDIIENEVRDSSVNSIKPEIVKPAETQKPIVETSDPVPISDPKRSTDKKFLTKLKNIWNA